MSEGWPFEADNDGFVEEPVRPDTDVPPPTIAEGIIEHIQAGFMPLKDYHLYKELKSLLNTAMESCVKEYHIIVSESAEAFIVLGKLPLPAQLGSLYSFFFFFLILYGNTLY